MKCDRRWWNDGRLDIEGAAQRSGSHPSLPVFEGWYIQEPILLICTRPGRTFRITLPDRD